MSDFTPKFPELPVDVQVALINAASNIAASKITAISVRGDYKTTHDFFKTEYERICDALYTENRGRK